MLKPKAIQGAARLSWNNNNPRVVLDQLIADHPKANKEKLFLLMWDKIKGNPDVLKNLFEYWFSNNYRTSTSTYDRETTRKAIDYLKNKMLLNLPLPNGKRLKDATFAECTKLGGFYAKIGAKGPARKKVGGVLSEEQLKKIADEEGVK